MRSVALLDPVCSAYPVCVTMSSQEAGVCFVAAPAPVGVVRSLHVICSVAIPDGTRIGAHLARTGQRARERCNELLVWRDPKETPVTHVALVPLTTQA